MPPPHRAGARSRPTAGDNRDVRRKGVRTRAVARPHRHEHAHHHHHRPPVHPPPPGPAGPRPHGRPDRHRPRLQPGLGPRAQRSGRHPGHRLPKFIRVYVTPSTWEDPDAPITGYTVERFVQGQAFPNKTWNVANVAPIVDPSAVLNTMYVYRARANSVDGPSAWSETGAAKRSVGVEEWDKFDTVGFVNRQYLDFLGRQPSNAERTNAVGNLDQGAWTSGELHQHARLPGRAAASPPDHPALQRLLRPQRRSRRPRLLVRPDREQGQEHQHRLEQLRRLAGVHDALRPAEQRPVRHARLPERPRPQPQAR